MTNFIIPISLLFAGSSVLRSKALSNVVISLVCGGPLARFQSQGIPDLLKLMKRAIGNSTPSLAAYCQKENIPHLKTNQNNGEDVLSFCKAHKCQ